MLRVRIILDPLDRTSFSEHTPEKLIPFLQEQFETWPETARIYRDVISQETDVTPRCEGDIEALVDDGIYYVVVYPGDPVTLIIVAVAVFVATLVVTLLLMPKIPQQGNAKGESSNNSLGQRVNKARPLARIPDIYGKVRAIPELLTYPLLIFVDNEEQEICYMCVGRGEYELDPALVYDGQTPLNLMAGAAADFYGPGTRPDNGDPILEVGSGVGFPLKNVLKLNEVNGQKLAPPNANSLTGAGNIKLVGPNFVIANPASSIDFTDKFHIGDELTISGAEYGGIAVFDATSQVCRFHPDRRIEFQSFDPSTLYEAGELLVIYNGYYVGQDGSGNLVNVDVSGTYTIDSVSTTEIQLG